MMMKNHHCYHQRRVPCHDSQTLLALAQQNQASSQEMKSNNHLQMTPPDTDTLVELTVKSLLVGEMQKKKSGIYFLMFSSLSYLSRSNFSPPLILFFLVIKHSTLWFSGPHYEG